MSEARWTVVMPVKRLGAAKSRLRGALPGVPHEELALALAADTLRAARACPAVAGVLVVTDDARVRARRTRRAPGSRRSGRRVERGVPARRGCLQPRAAVAGLTADLARA
nr:hypothetical protein [Micromonospora sp. M42]